MKVTVALVAGVDVSFGFHLSCALLIPAGGCGEGSSQCGRSRADSSLHLCLRLSGGLLLLAAASSTVAGKSALFAAGSKNFRGICCLGCLLCVYLPFSMLRLKG